MTTQLSLTMIVRDEESTLGRVLGQAATFCDEMVIVDTGSQDHTPEVAREAGARVLDFLWIDDFAAARNAYAIPLFIRGRDRCVHLFLPPRAARPQSSRVALDRRGTRGAHDPREPHLAPRGPLH